MSYFKYIFSDKKAAIYWILILLGLLFASLLQFTTNSARDASERYSDIWSFIFLFIHGFIFIGFYTMSFFKYKLQHRFLTLYDKKIDKNSNNLVEIYQDSFSFKNFRQNVDVKMNIKPRLDRFSICTFGKNLVLLGQVYDLGIFRRHLKPIYILLAPTEKEKLKYVLEPRIGEYHQSNDELTIRFKNNVDGINKLVIKDYKSNSH